MELQPPRNTVIISSAKMNMTKTKSPSKEAKPVLPAMGITKSAVSGKAR
jgi:hypothetical protein